MKVKSENEGYARYSVGSGQMESLKTDSDLAISVDVDQ
jgi:hypothetical protein